MGDSYHLLNIMCRLFIEIINFINNDEINLKNNNNVQVFYLKTVKIL